MQKDVYSSYDPNRAKGRAMNAARNLTLSLAVASALALSPSAVFAADVIGVDGVLDIAADVDGSAYGYKANDATDRSNYGVVTMNSDVTVTSNVVGGYNESTGSVNGASVTITDGTVANSVFGGYSIGGSASSNTVTIDSANVSGDVEGGSSTGGSASSNTVTINSANVLGGVEGGTSSIGAATGNTVTIDSATVSGGDVFGGNSDNGAATGNTVTINNGSTVGGSVYGGYSTDGDASNNTVTVEDSTVDTSVFGGYSDNGAATGNTVNLKGTTVVALTVIGGFTDGDFTDAGNTINVSGTVSADSIYGFDTLGLTASSSNVDTAVLTLVGVDVLDLTGKTLNVVGSGTTSGTSYKLITVDEGGDGIVLSNTTVNSSGTFIASSKTVTFSTSSKTSDKNTLTTSDLGIDTSNGGGGDSGGGNSGGGNSGGGNSGGGNSGGGNSGGGTTTTVTANKSTEALSATSLGSAALVASAGSFVASSVTEQAVSKANSSSEANAADGNSNLNNGGWASFAAVEGGSNKYKIGSSITVKSINLAIGAVRNTDIGLDTLTIAPFIETGYGKSDADISGASTDSKHKYIGAGLLGRYTLNFGTYAEASVRGGKTWTKFEGDFTNPYTNAKTKADYDSGAGYFGFHLGLGHDFALTERITLEPYAKYIYTYMKGDDITVHASDSDVKLKTEATKAHAGIFGAKIKFDQGDLRYYAGAAFQKVWNGKTKSELSQNGVSVNPTTPTIGGNSGVGELGLKWSVTRAVSLDFNVKGYVGDQKGVNGGLNVMFKF